MFGSSEVTLKPSEILFSQESIKTYFYENGNHSCKRIGETLDDLCEGRCSISNIPRISVMKIGVSWVTADNRRLWIFQNLERLGRCDCITARIVYSMRPEKLNSTNDGKTVRVRGDPGGTWHSKDGHTNRGYDSSYRPTPTTDDSSLLQGILIAGAALLWWMIAR